VVEILQHQRGGAFGEHEAVAVLGERLRRLLRRVSASGVNEPSAPTASAAWHSPRLIASTPSWIALAPDAQAVLSAIGEPSVPK
jgi:hypothetical protein